MGMSASALCAERVQQFVDVVEIIEPLREREHPVDVALGQAFAPLGARVRPGDAAPAVAARVVDALRDRDAIGRRDGDDGAAAIGLVTVELGIAAQRDARAQAREGGIAQDLRERRLARASARRGRAPRSACPAGRCCACRGLSTTFIVLVGMPTSIDSIASSPMPVLRDQRKRRFDRRVDRVARVEQLEVGAHDGVALAEPARRGLAAALDAPGVQHAVRRADDVLVAFQAGDGHQRGADAGERELAVAERLADVPLLCVERAQRVGWKVDSAIAWQCRIASRPSSRLAAVQP